MNWGGASYDPRVGLLVTQVNRLPEYVRLIPGARAHFAMRGGHALTKTEPDLFNRIALEFFTELTA